MKSINVKVSDEAREIIDVFQKDNNINSLDNTVDRFILETKNKGENKV